MLLHGLVKKKLTSPPEWLPNNVQNLSIMGSTLPYKPDEGAIKALLLKCLEHQYGSLDKCVNDIGKSEQAIVDIRAVLERFA
jgi:hypothetical protein